MDFKALLDISDFIIYQLNFFENGIIYQTPTVIRINLHFLSVRCQIKHMPLMILQLNFLMIMRIAMMLRSSYNLLLERI